MAKGKQPRGDKILCPSVAEISEETVAFAAIVPSRSGNPVVGYFNNPVSSEVASSLLANVNVEAGQIFRLAAPCAEDKCKNFGNGSCQLSTRIVESFSSNAVHVPPCSIRASCRWWREHGSDICRKCAAVVSVDPRRPPEERSVAEPQSTSCPDVASI